MQEEGLQARIPADDDHIIRIVILREETMPAHALRPLFKATGVPMLTSEGRSNNPIILGKLCRIILRAPRPIVAQLGGPIRGMQGTGGQLIFRKSAV